MEKEDGMKERTGRIERAFHGPKPPQGSAHSAARVVSPRSLAHGRMGRRDGKEGRGRVMEDRRKECGRRKREGRGGRWRKWMWRTEGRIGRVASGATDVARAEATAGLSTKCSPRHAVVSASPEGEPGEEPEPS